MLCKICFDKMTRAEEYDLRAGMKYSWAFCADCRNDVCVASRPLEPRDQWKLMKLYYDGDTEKERLIW